MNRQMLTYITMMMCFPLFAQEESSSLFVDSLVFKGYENVSYTSLENEEVIVLENVTYKANGEGVQQAIGVLDKLPFDDSKQRRVVVLVNNVPRYSLVRAVGGAWKTSYNR